MTTTQEARRWRLGFRVAARETDSETGKAVKPRSYRRGPSERRPAKARPPAERDAWQVGVPQLEQAGAYSAARMVWRALDDLAPT